MSDLDNNNLTNEEENSGFSPSDSDNKSFSPDKGSQANSTGNKDWGQTDYFVKPPRKTPLWPFLLVGAFVVVGIIAILFMSSRRCDYDQMLKSEAEGSAAYVKGSKEHQTQHIAIDKKIVVEVKVNDKHSRDMDRYSTNRCKPNEKCNPKDCKPGGKCDPKLCKPMDDKSNYSHHNMKNREQVEVKAINKELPRPIKKGTPPKPGKPALQDNATGLYVLQVYAALSKEDADAKYEEFKNKGAEKVWVSTYTHENVIWYRVRIGDFTTKAQAETKARELGITTYWVDRIR